MGHFPMSDDNVAAGLAYLEKLRASVLAGLKAGKTLEQLKASIKMEKYRMEKYRSWGSYDNWRALNVEGMARHLKQSGAVN